jgi:DNA modification methylase
MGSGTTAIACMQSRRKYIGFELNKEYYDKAVKRIETEKAQLTLF